MRSRSALLGAAVGVATVLSVACAGVVTSEGERLVATDRPGEHAEQSVGSSDDDAASSPASEGAAEPASSDGAEPAQETGTDARASDPSPEPAPPTAAEQFCADLASGLTPPAIWAAAADAPPSARRVDVTRDYVAEACPAELEANELLEIYLEKWAVAPGLVNGEGGDGPDAPSSPVPFGVAVPVRVTSSGPAHGSTWTTIVGAPRDITADIADVSPDDPPPAPGTRYTAVPVEMTLDAASPVPPDFDVTWQVAGGSSGTVTAATDPPCAPYLNARVDESREVVPGATVRWMLCLEVPLADIGHPDTVVVMNLLDLASVIFGPVG